MTRRVIKRARAVPKGSPDSGQLQRMRHLHHTSRGAMHVDVETIPIRDRAGRVA